MQYSNFHFAYHHWWLGKDTRDNKKNRVYFEPPCAQCQFVHRKKMGGETHFLSFFCLYKGEKSQDICASPDGNLALKRCHTVASNSQRDIWLPLQKRPCPISEEIAAKQFAVVWKSRQGALNSQKFDKVPTSVATLCDVVFFPLSFPFSFSSLTHLLN